MPEVLDGVVLEVEVGLRGVLLGSVVVGKLRARGVEAGESVVDVVVSARWRGVEGVVSSS